MCTLGMIFPEGRFIFLLHTVHLSSRSAGSIAMCDPEGQGENAPNRLSNRDAIQLPDELSLSDSDPDDTFTPFGQRVEDLSSSSDEDEARGHRQPGVPPPTLPPPLPPSGRGESVFQLRGGSLGFSDRSRSIFESLESAVKLTSAQLGDDNVLSGTFARPAPPSPPPLSRGGRKSGGSPGRAAPKQPPPPQTAPVAASKVPDYLAHPERWTRYSLEDVPETSDRRNSQVAHQLIQGLQDTRRRSQEDRDESFMPSFNQSQGSGDQHKILFSKPRLGSREEGGKAGRQRKAGVGLLHLDEAQDEEEGARPDRSRHGHPRKEDRKRKWAPNKEWGDEDDPEEEPEKPTSVAFSISSKKVNRKHFRKMAEQQPQEEEEED
ncbi:protein TSSC4 isoform X1 [Alosa sapidissima]|uniref:protein TSSC4 isoform X1 n=2 Tax=Alosa sapidissima TaxID=34773 RepID=UPI001C08EA9C|nr:protein TSSC4 isoform X1 [Alosa sapidissima]XP_041930221.1 protein TSSC4 isoform X1 [Alosa sapidissima]XP_041930222.1 protein TSSC4 isoform X1 [Alosa sapidissima]